MEKLKKKVKTVIIDCISDLHGYYPKLDGGDLLIVAGDLTARDEPYQHAEFLSWAKRQDYEKVIFIAGNHDGHIQNNQKLYEDYMGSCRVHCPSVKDFNKITYLQDSYTIFKHLKIYGSPWTPTFCDWHFMLPRESDELEEKWSLIPDDTDILITHGPSYGLLDSTCQYPSKFDCLGCSLLREAVERIKPKIHVFGHIHGGYGQILLKHEGLNTICVNASHCDEDYKPVNKPIRIVL